VTSQVFARKIKDSTDSTWKMWDLPRKIGDFRDAHHFGASSLLLVTSSFADFLSDGPCITVKPQRWSFFLPEYLSKITEKSL
jgi:hypothetical protein